MADMINFKISETRSILKEKHEIEVPPSCDQFLVRCLRLKNEDVKKTVKLAQAFYHVSGEFANWDAALQPSLYDANFYSLPKVFPLVTRDKKNRRVFIGQAKMWYPDKISFDEGAVATWMMAQLAVGSSEEDQKNGFVVIWDFTGFTLQHAWAIKQRKFVSFAKWTQNGVLGKMKGLQIVNHCKLVGFIYSATKPFLSEKMRKRINFHSDMEKLYKSLELERKYLPKFLGGDLETDECMDKEFMKELLKSDAFFQDMVNNRFPAK